MAILKNITGVDKVLRNMSLAGVAIGRQAASNLKKAGLFLQRESQKVVPVDTANLKSGASTRNIGGEGFTADIIVSFEADYASYVHEDMDARHKEGKQAKYLEGPARENRSEILKIVGEG